MAFIAETVAELSKLAKRHRLEILSHLLGMAQLEALAAAKQAQAVVTSGSNPSDEL